MVAECPSEITGIPQTTDSTSAFDEYPITTNVSGSINLLKVSASIRSLLAIGLDLILIGRSVCFLILE